MIRKISNFILGGLLFCSTSIAQQIPQRIISADFNKEIGLRKSSYKECIGAGRASEGLRSDWQQQLREVKQACDFKYIRFHGLLNDEMGVCTIQNGKIHYNFQYVDVLYDFLLSIDIKPFVELGFMPSPLKSNDRTVFWWKGNISPPADYTEYEKLITALTRHFTERYGEEEVKTWYFEVWNEPNHHDFFTGTKEDYLELYASAAKAIKNVNKAYRVGGPATAESAWVPDIINYCHSNQIPLDFVSTHTYGVKGHLDEFGVRQLFMIDDKDEIVKAVAGVRRQVNESLKPDLELHYTEWSSSYSSRDPVHDSYPEATYMLNIIKNTEQLATSMSYWTFTDIFEEGGPAPSAFHGGFGLMNVHGIKKPAFHVYSFLNQLGTIELENKDNASWICKDNASSVQILAWDFTFLKQGKEPNQIFYRQLLPPEKKGNLKISLQNMKPGKYICEVSSVGYEKGDVFSTYYKMGLPVELTKTQEKYLKNIGNNVLYQTEIITVETSGRFETTLPLNANDVYFIQFIKI
ncbi:Beta-xylosidase [termite gut metagenome]|uniref:Beta-xylosidase n=1 Tax=termite gut metagenome TaxID=433724 RepID=A0A5J4SRB5_9ZZZZ